MPLLKPPRGTQLNRAQPLARSLGLCWLFNEGSGAKFFDMSGNGWTGAHQGSPTWISGPYGFALYFDGDDDCVQTSSPVITSAPVSVSLWFKIHELPSVRAEDGTLLVQRNVGSPYHSFRTLVNDADDKILLLIYDSSGINTVNISSDSAVQAGIWYHVVFILDSNYDACMYVNGVQQAGTGNSGSLYNANDVLRLGSRTGTTDDFKGKIDLVTIFNRSLSTSEIQLLNREPLFMFERLKSTEWIISAPTVVSLVGSTSAQSATSGTLKILSNLAVRERSWLKAALLNGMTPNALKLGTTLTLGWFWMRTAGCSALYRGMGMDQIDFTKILAIASPDAEVISPAGYVKHDLNSTYFYVFRRFNSFGYQEQTLDAASKVIIDADGELLEPQPNKIFAISSDQAKDNRILISWFYCPLDQKSKPECFKVYYDNGTGRIDCQTPLASIDYHGRKHYKYLSDTLEPGQYIFSVKAEDDNGVESNSVLLSVQINAASPSPIEIISAGSF